MERCNLRGIRSRRSWGADGRAMRYLSLLVGVLVLTLGTSCVRRSRPAPKEDARSAELFRRAFEQHQHMQSRSDSCRVRLHFERGAAVDGPPVIVAAHTGEWGAPRSVYDQVFVLPTAVAVSGVDLRLDPCRPVVRWTVLVPNRAPVEVFSEQRLSVEHDVKLPWPAPPTHGGESVVYERTGRDLQGCLFLEMRDAEDAGQVRAVMPPKWVGGYLADMSRRGLRQSIDPKHFDPQGILLMGPWEGEASQYKSDGPEGLVLRRGGGWHVASLLAVGPAQDRPNVLDYRILVLYRIPESEAEPIELLWTRRYIPLPRARAPDGHVMIVNSLVEPKGYEVRDLR